MCKYRHNNSFFSLRPSFRFWEEGPTSSPALKYVHCASAIIGNRFIEQTGLFVDKLKYIILLKWRGKQEIILFIIFLKNTSEI